MIKQWHICGKNLLPYSMEIISIDDWMVAIKRGCPWNVPEAVATEYKKVRWNEGFYFWSVEALPCEAQQKRERRQWDREPPERLLSLLEKASLDSAFKTYTIHRKGVCVMCVCVCVCVYTIVQKFVITHKMTQENPYFIHQMRCKIKKYSRHYQS